MSTDLTPGYVKIVVSVGEEGCECGDPNCPNVPHVYEQWGKTVLLTVVDGESEGALAASLYLENGAAPPEDRDEMVLHAVMPVLRMLDSLGLLGAAFSTYATIKDLGGTTLVMHRNPEAKGD